MDIQEKTEILQSLQSGLDTLVLSIHGLNEESASQNPEAERWSMADVAQVNKGREALMRKRGADRSHPIRHAEQIAEIRNI